MYNGNTSTFGVVTAGLTSHSRETESLFPRKQKYFGPISFIFWAVLPISPKPETVSVCQHSSIQTNRTCASRRRASTPLMLSSVEDGACSRSAEHVNQGRKVPRRKYGIQRNTRLPSSVPIVGLGCSSFSTFFSSDDSDVDGPLTVDAVSADLPIVQSWIATIR
jgi:hypothetical protein